MIKYKKDTKIFYKEPDDMIKKPDNYRKNTDNIPDMKKVKKYYSQKKVK